MSHFTERDKLIIFSNMVRHRAYSVELRTSEMMLDLRLENWQQRLASHFAELRKSRGDDVQKYPIFGLEHGLNSHDLEDLKSAIRDYSISHRPSRGHALAWIVYSSEIGYQYSGDEYWQTFERETPGWIRNGDRYQLRSYYRQFQKEFGGVEPSGNWAEHFSIICWPITHAVLPKDLQRQLARILYEMRYAFSSDLLSSFEELGTLVAARSLNASSRFRNFVQDTRLVGQISASLLLQDEIEGYNRMYPEALRRITEDLDKERQARDWLRGARQSARERVKVRGLGSHRQRERLSNFIHKEAREQVATLGIEPHLMLRPKGSDNGPWDMYLEVPDLHSLFLRFPETQDVLTNSRCSVSGTSGRPAARGKFLHGSQRFKLTRWPQATDVLLKFEKSHPQLDFLLRTECLLRPNPIRLFRIASDGVAYECRSLRVRTGERYILVSDAGPIHSNEHTKPIELDCEGIQGDLIEIPEVLTTDWQEALQNIGLEQTRTFEVRPAGLSATEWDGDGYGEWFENDLPCLSIRADHPLSSIRLSFDDGVHKPIEVSPATSGEPIFVELPQLPVGVHNLIFSVKTDSVQSSYEFDDLNLTIRIRREQSRDPTNNPAGLLLVYVDPITPTLEQLWEGQSELSIQGPIGRAVNCRISLFQREGIAPSVANDLPALTLPVTNDAWQDYFQRHFQSNDKVQNAYDISRICLLEFSAAELGKFAIRCEREFTPIRWSISTNSRAAQIHDDSGESGEPLVRRFSFENPLAGEVLPFAKEYLITDKGGMYVAQTLVGRLHAAIIVPPVFQGKSFSSLRIEPFIAWQEPAVESAVKMIKTVELWSQARLSGNILSNYGRQKVLRTLDYEISRFLCGEGWATAEKKFMASGIPRVDYDTLSNEFSQHPSEIGTGRMLLNAAITSPQAICENPVRSFMSLMVRWQLLEPDSEWIAELALRLASAPASVQTWAGQYLVTGLEQLMDRPLLMRASRLLVLVTDRSLQPRTAFGKLYPNWRWP